MAEIDERAMRGLCCFNKVRCWFNQHGQQKAVIVWCDNPSTTDDPLLCAQHATELGGNGRRIARTHAARQRRYRERVKARARDELLAGVLS